MNLEIQVYKENKMLSIKEVAELLGIAPTSVRKFINDGKLLSYKYSDRKTKVRLIDVEKFNKKNSNSHTFN